MKKIKVHNRKVCRFIDRLTDKSLLIIKMLTIMSIPVVGSMLILTLLIMGFNLNYLIDITCVIAILVVLMGIIAIPLNFINIILLFVFDTERSKDE